jgi:predicted transcriptional regulator
VDGTITKKMKQGLQPKFHPFTVVYQGNIQDYKKQLNLGEKDLPYFFVLDAQGKILYHTSGAYNDRKLADIIDAVESVK